MLVSIMVILLAVTPVNQLLRLMVLPFRASTTSAFIICCISPFLTRSWEECTAGENSCVFATRRSCRQNGPYGANDKLRYVPSVMMSQASICGRDAKQASCFRITSFAAAAVETTKHGF